MPKITAIFLSIAAVLPLTLPVEAATHSASSNNDAVATQPEQLLAQRMSPRRRVIRRPRCRIVRRRVCRRVGRFRRPICRIVTRRICYR